jgi:hypothetical protein
MATIDSIATGVKEYDGHVLGTFLGLHKGSNKPD